jgi:peptide/nickel transport system ATP-binding protein
VSGHTAGAAGDGTFLDIRDLTITTAAGVHLVKDVSITVPRGGSVGIVGESGSGKTLTCRALLGILPPGLTVSAGSIDLDGRELVGLDEREWRRIWGSRVGAVFQDPASYLNPSIRVGSQLAESLRVAGGLGRKAAKARALELFAAVGLRDPERVARQYAFELSGGMLQRVLIAIAVSADPELLVADEATTALDVTVQAEVLDLIAALRVDRQLTLVLVSHDLSVIAQMCEYIYVFKDGRVIEHGETRRVLTEHEHPYTQLLVESHERYGMDKLVNAEASR